MRNWNSEFWEVLGLHLVFAFRLPMRNWNDDFNRIMGEMETLSDYLWGIETVNWSFVQATTIRFQTTYEELKQLQHVAFGFVHAAFRLPMRNWNTGPLSSERLQKKSFQTTYEELKHVVFPIAIVPSWAFRLPMRNWNFHGSEDKALRDKGFQTTYEELKLTLPPTSRSRSRRFQTTYEELKRSVQLRHL